MSFEQRMNWEVLARMSGWLLAFVCAVLMVRIGIVLVDGVEIGFEPIPLSVSNEFDRPISASDWSMFGRPTDADYGFSEAVPATPLALRLRGVVTGERGYAIIVDTEGSEGVYRVDDEVPGGAVVVAIEPRRVVFSRAGGREALELPGSSQSGSAGRSRPQPSRDNGQSPALGIGIGSLAGLTSQFTLDPEALARQIIILPVAGGGFRVRAGRDAGLFDQLGFHVNDIVLAINGRPVDTAADVRALFESFRPGQPIAITVKRGDSQRVLTPDFADSSQFPGARP